MLVILVISVVSTGVFSGCSNQSAKPPFFSDTDSQILTSAYTDYNNFKQNSSPITARQELVKKLNTEKGVAYAYLGTDGTSIFFTYDDGFLGIVDTYDPNESPQQVTNYSPNDESEVLLTAIQLNYTLVQIMQIQ